MGIVRCWAPLYATSKVFGLGVLLIGCTSDEPDTSGSDRDSVPSPGDTESGPQDSRRDTDVDPDDSEPVGVIDERMDLQEMIACENPAAGISYQEVGEAMGLNGPVVPDEERQVTGGTIGVGDLDGDGDYDLVVGFREESPWIYWRVDDHFEPQALGEPPNGENVQLADMDGNGWTDLVFGGSTRPVIYLNDAGEFTVLTLPKFENQHHSEELVPGDLDGDGDNDLYVLMASSGDDSAEERSDFVFWNQGDGAFTRDADVIPQEGSDGVGFDAALFDWDADGDQDVYVGNDHGNLYGGNALFENTGGGGFRDASEDCKCDIAMAAMGVDVADFHPDGIPDIIVSDATVHRLLQGYDDGTYVDVHSTAGLDPGGGIAEMGWGMIFLDWDNDGDQDILGAMGLAIFSPADWESQDGTGLILMDNDGEGHLTDVGPEMGLEEVANMRSVVALDLNEDGVQDLIATVVNRRPQIYLSESCTAANWLVVEAPAGSRVEVRAGGQTWVDWVSLASSYAAASPAVVHFGLGDAAVVDRLEVTWPDGEVLLWSEPFDARRRVLVHPE